MKTVLWWIIPIGLTLAVLYGIYQYAHPASENAGPPPAVQVPPAPAASAAPPAPPAAPTHYPIPDAAGADAPADLAGKDIPKLAESDTALRAALVGLVGEGPFDAFFWPKEIVRRIVATVDNLPRGRVSQNMMPIKKTAGRFQVRTQGDAITMDPANTGRYRTYVDLFDALPTHQAVAAYVHLYPLFQEAYKDLGYPNGYFNDRLVAAIDDLLAAPEPLNPPRLLEPHLMYEFADPDIEALSAGQKIMIRLGPQYEKRVKNKLTQFRSELTNPASKPQG